jgi:RimJ/RimL family protein N-acetyltransferase
MKRNKEKIAQRSRRLIKQRESKRKKKRKKNKSIGKEKNLRNKKSGVGKLDYLKTLILYVACKDGLYIFNDGIISKDVKNYTEEEAIEMIKIDNAVYYEPEEEITDLGFFDPMVIHKRIGDVPEKICFLKDKDMKIVSFCFVFFDYHLPKNEGVNINNVAVLPSLSGKGICQYMISEVSRYLLLMEPMKPLTIGFEHIDTKYSKFNIASCKCYLRVGFRLINSLSELGKRILSYDSGGNDFMIKYNIEYKGVIYNLIETSKFSTFMLVHKDSISEYDKFGINQYYDIDDKIVCTKEFSGRLNESIQSGCSIM